MINQLKIRIESISANGNLTVSGIDLATLNLLNVGSQGLITIENTNPDDPTADGSKAIANLPTQ